MKIEVVKIGNKYAVLKSEFSLKKYLYNETLNFRSEYLEACNGFNSISQAESQYKKYLNKPMEPELGVEIVLKILN